MSGRQLSEWYQHSGFIIQITLPKFVKTRNGTNVVDQSTHYYLLQLSCPRYSMFDTTQACAESGDFTRSPSDAGLGSKHLGDISSGIAQRITPQLVNNFKLAASKSLHDYVSGFDWYSQFLRRSDNAPGNSTQGTNTPQDPPTTTVQSTQPQPAPSPPAASDQTGQGAPAQPPASVRSASTGGNSTQSQPRTQNDYASFCNSVVDALYNAGLSTLDARIGLWATMSGSPEFVGIVDGAENNPACHNLLPPGGAWHFVEHPPQRNSSQTKRSSRRR